MPSQLTARHGKACGRFGLWTIFLAPVHGAVTAGVPGPNRFRRNASLHCVALRHHRPWRGVSPPNILMRLERTRLNVYLRSFRVLVPSVSGSERAMAHTASAIPECIRTSVSNQYLMLMPALFPRHLATRPPPPPQHRPPWLPPLPRLRVMTDARRQLQPQRPPTRHFPH